MDTSSSRERALERLVDGEITVTKAAEIAGMTDWEFAAFVNEGDAIWISSEHLEGDLEKS